MAEKRMFTKKITESDAFLEMPATTQNLYFHLNMEADDDGFVNSPKKIMKLTNATEDDMKLLILKKFVIYFENGIIVIKHWRMHNLLRQDRYHPTQYQEEFKLLTLDSENNYHLTGLSKNENDPQISWQPNGNQMATEDRLDKDSKDKNSKDIRHKHGQYDNVLLTDEELEKLKAEFPNDYEQRIERVSEYCASTGKSYKNYLATIRNWARKDKPQENDLPTYVPTKNIMSKAEEEEILRLMGKQ